MTEDFFNFIPNTTKENFINSQNEIFSSTKYNPYSEDLNIMENLLDENNFQKVTEYNNINTLLSPRAHLYKNYALEKLSREKDSKSELIFAEKIMEGICITGNGSKTLPYIVTRISDEKDVLSYLQEEFISQNLVKDNGKIYDLINCKSGNEIYFDITTPYLKMQSLMNNGEIELPFKTKKKSKNSAPKKWWKFWS